MILPDKHISPERSLLAAGGVILQHLEHPLAINRLWERVREDPTIRSYDSFVLTLALLYGLRAVGELDGVLVRMGS
jgi:hypothetical protein